MRVLLVEDDLQLGAAFHRAFELHRFEPTWVRRLKEARTVLEQSEPSVVVLDLGLPDGQGLTLLESMRRKRCGVPVIILTARDGVDDCVRGLNSGADDYVTKPVAVPELVARIHAVARRAAGFAASCLTIGELSVDLDQHRVSLHGTPVQLTLTEFRLLVALAGYAGRVVARETLIAAVWERVDHGSDMALDYQVHGLRKKIGGERIVTVRGVGFQLQAL